jgi:all-trans-retinol 13,14-reductase
MALVLESAARSIEEVPGAVVPRVRAKALFDRSWDAIVVGAGVGGLVAGTLLATRAGWRVLVLERHYQPGGLTQSFRRRRHEFDVGVHYVGDVGTPRAPLRRLLDAITGGRLAWNRLPDPYDRVRLHDDDGELVEVGIATGLPRMREALLRFAPTEERAIDRYLDELRTCARHAPGFLLSRASGLAVDRHPFYRWADVTAAEHLASLGLSPRLVALVTAHYANYGAPPSRGSFAAHCFATAHYLEGAYYPVGGGGRIGRELASTLARHGSAVVVRAEVERIVLEHDRAVGVRLVDGHEVRAPIVISDTGAAVTFGRLLDEDAPGVGAMRETIEAIGCSAAHAALYVGTNRSARELGLSGANLWITPGVDEAPMQAWLRGERDTPAGMFVSFTSVNDPSWPARMPGRASLVASTQAPYDAFAAWSEGRPGHRPPEYEALKERMTRGMIALLVKHVPSLEGAIEHAEMSSPLSTRHYAAHPRGETYGLDHSPRRFRRGPTAATPIAGLYLAGQDVWVCGVGGAAFGGLACASTVLRRDLMREIFFG